MSERFISLPVIAVRQVLRIVRNVSNIECPFSPVGEEWGPYLVAMMGSPAARTRLYSKQQDLPDYWGKFKPKAAGAVGCMYLLCMCISIIGVN